MTTGICIPAHMHSRRFPGKPLADVGGRPLLSYAVEAAIDSGLPWCVATPSERVEHWVYDTYENDGRITQKYTICLTTGKARNGTERAAMVNELLKWDRVIVLQCDEPDVTGEDLRHLAERFESPATISTAMGDKDWGNPNSVAADRCICDLWNDACFRFLRAALKDEGCRAHWSRHVGVYLYDAPMLADYLRHPPTPAEETQSLEQLRTMAMGYAWSLMTIPGPLRSINVPEDVEAFK